MDAPPATTPEALIAQVHPVVARIARARFGDGSEADDVVQETLIRVVSRIGQWGGRIPVEHWAARIAVNLCCDRQRRLRRRREVPIDAAGPIASGHADAVADARATVERLLDLLSPADRLVVVLLDLEQRSTREIAALTGFSRIAIKVRAMRARRTLRAHAARLEIAP